MAKFINKITWNKGKTKPQYEIATTANRIFITQDSCLTVLDFFNWVSSFFREGSFFYYGSKEPQAKQTYVWIDTTTKTV